MLRYRTNSTKEHYVTPSDPFLYTVYACILPVIVIIILAILVLVFKLPSFLIYAILGFVISSIFLSGTHTNKKEQLGDIYFLFGFMLVGFVGMDICAQNLMLALTWIILFSFFGYLIVIYKDVKRGYVALVVTFLPVILHERFPLGIGVEAFNSFQIILNDVVSIIILFTIILVFALLYPMRHKTTSLIASIESLYLVRNILFNHINDKPISDIQMKLDDYLEKLNLNIGQIRFTEKNRQLQHLLIGHYSTLVHLELVLNFCFETDTLPKSSAEFYIDKINSVMDGGSVTKIEDVEIPLQGGLSNIQQKALSELKMLMQKILTSYSPLIEYKKQYA